MITEEIDLLLATNKGARYHACKAACRYNAYCAAPVVIETQYSKH